MENKDNKFLIDDLSFRYENSVEKTLKNLKISLKKGEVHLLLGDSGSGKSTFINILSGIIPNDILGEVEGELIYKNVDILKNDIQKRAKDIGIVFQNLDSSF